MGMYSILKKEKILSFDVFFPAVTVLFVAMDPIGNMPLFMSLTNSPREDYPKNTARKSVLIGGAILFVFAFAGESFLKMMGITLPSFRVAGGIMLFIIALQMVFGGDGKKDDDGETAGRGDVAVFPLAVPLIAGPASITTVMLLMSEAKTPAHQITVSAAMVAVLGISYAAFRLSGFVSRVLGESFNQVITKILGLVLGAMAAQFVDGLKQLMII